MSEITGTATAHEAYAFCCMRCGHGWEQAYDIEHYVDGSGKNVVVYKSEGIRVPSPLSSPTCVNCGGHVVRIMRSGQVSSVHALMTERHHPAKRGRDAAAEVGKTGVEGVPAQPGGEISAGADGHGPSGDGRASEGEDSEAGHHHWHLSDLLHPFHHRK
ncbi:hypothetical protein ACIOJD_28075 [Streptomyces sp. NPDC088116]|uniref:hypothetical protein n=1 Tax=Streptomyces sp. NPDC088116 TaxID=3365825 RepID=UPI00382AD525